MRLQTRILLGYGYLVSLLVISATSAAVGFQRLGAGLNRVLSENYQSVRASMAMLEALERQDSAVLAQLLADGDSSRNLITSSEASFLKALGDARANITIAEEETLVRTIEDGFTAFRQARDRLLADLPDRPLRAYEDETLPRFEDLKARVYELLDLNQVTMVAADTRAQREASNRAVLHGLLVMVALLSLGLISRTVRGDILARLTDLAAVADAIGNGEIHRRATVTRDDELGVVAVELNRMLDRLQALRAGFEGREAETRQLVLALLERTPDTVGVVSLDGRVLASKLDASETAAIEGQLAALTASRDSDPPSRHDLEIAGHRGRLELLRVDGARPVGWIVRLGSDPAPAPEEQQQS
jgi:HAMP domain-containing protein